MKTFDRLKVLEQLDSETRDLLRGKVQEFESQLNALRHGYRVMVVGMLVGFVALALPFELIIPTNSLQLSPDTIIEELEILVLIIVIVGVPMFMYSGRKWAHRVSVHPFLKGDTEFLICWGLVFVCVITISFRTVTTILYALLTLLHSPLARTPEFQLKPIIFDQNFTIILISVYLLFIAMAIPLLSLIRYFSASKISRHPSAYIIDKLIYTLVDIEGAESTFGEIETKQSILARLEAVAECLEIYLPARLRSGDPVTDLWWRANLAQAAAALRDKKKWVLTPKADSRENFTQSVFKMLVDVANGTWDGLDRMTVESLSRRQLWRGFIQSFMRIIVLAALPLLGLWIIQGTPLALAEPMRGYATAIVLIWTVVSILSSLDPLFNSKVAAIKDLGGLLRPGSETDKK